MQFLFNCLKARDWTKKQGMSDQGTIKKNIKTFGMKRENRNFASTISASPLYNAYQGGTFFYMLMATYTKQTISIADQITILKNRGLLFDDENTAIEYLKIISYFRLANYWKPMENDKVNHVFKPNSKFENVLTLYNFDKELRNLIFSGIVYLRFAMATSL